MPADDVRGPVGPRQTVERRPIKWIKVIDQTRCIGCHACTTACKSENEVPLGVTRTYVKSVDVGIFPLARRAFQVTRCNQCEDAPCVTACPTAAMYKRADGIVDFMKAVCIGCKACIAACPYDAIFINPEDHAAEKCNFCAHRIDMGLEPACVVVCPTEAILIGDLHDPSTRVARIVTRESVAVRRPEKDSKPQLFYKGAHQATLDPLAARRPGGDLFMWSQQHTHDGAVTSGHPAHANNSAAAMLSYDVPHEAPWGWRVSLYTWTKGIAAGAYLVPLLLVLSGLLPAESAFWRWVAPLVAAAALAITGGLLVWDLKHPERFYLIFTRPQWGSWLVRGAFIIAGYGLVLAAHLLAGLAGSTGALQALMLAGLPLGIMTAVYTAYLFAQAKARDAWQNPLLGPHLLAQAFVLGGAAILPFAGRLDASAFAWCLRVIAGGGLLHLCFVTLEHTLPHTTAHARLASWEMTRGRFRAYFWAGAAAVAVSTLAPWIGGAGAAAALVGLMAYEHAHVQAAQAVPLA